MTAWLYVECKTDPKRYCAHTIVKGTHKKTWFMAEWDIIQIKKSV